MRGTTPAAGQQLPLFVPQAARTARLGWQLARLALTYGEDRVRRVAITDPEAPLPETRWTWRPVGLDGESWSWPPRRRLDRGPPVMTRLLREHPAIDVELDADGRLTAIRWNGRREVVEVCNRWRVEEAWWREPIARDYLKVVGERWLALVYLDRIAGTWHLERPVRLSHRLPWQCTSEMNVHGSRARSPYRDTSRAHSSCERHCQWTDSLDEVDPRTAAISGPASPSSGSR